MKTLRKQWLHLASMSRYINDFNYYTWLNSIFLFINLVAVIKQYSFFSCRWRKSRCRPPTQRMTALCCDTFMTVSSLWHENLQIYALTFTKTTNDGVLHQLLSHQGEKALTAWHDRKSFDTQWTWRRDFLFYCNCYHMFFMIHPVDKCAQLHRSCFVEEANKPVSNCRIWYWILQHYL